MRMNTVICESIEHKCVLCEHMSWGLPFSPISRDPTLTWIRTKYCDLVRGRERLIFGALRITRSPSGSSGSAPRYSPPFGCPCKTWLRQKHGAICDVTWREIQTKKCAVHPDGLDHAAGVVGPGDAVRGQIGELPIRWWS